MEEQGILEEELNVKQAIWRPPFRGLLFGGSQMGKTEYFISLLKNLDKLMPQSNYFSIVRVFYGCWSEKLRLIVSLHPNVILSKGLPGEILQNILENQEIQGEKRSPELWFLDDLFLDVLNSKSGIASLYLNASHHCNISCLISCHSTFSNAHGNQLRLLSLNSSVLLIWYNYRDQKTAQYLGKQVFSKYSTQFLPEALEDCAKRNRFKPVVINVSNQFQHNDCYRVASGVLPDEELIVYLPTNK